MYIKDRALARLLITIISALVRVKKRKMEDGMNMMSTLLRLTLVVLLEVTIVFFTAWSSVISLYIFAPCLGLTLLIWSETRKESGLISRSLFIFVLALHLYSYGRLVWNGGYDGGWLEIIMFASGIVISSGFDC